MYINFINSEVKKQLRRLQKKQQNILKISKVFLVFGLIFLFLSFAPSVWYSSAAVVDDFSLALLKTAQVSQTELEDTVSTVQIPEWQPTLDPKLSRNTTLFIPKIGVDTKIVEKTYQNYEDALKLGVWRIPDFGTPVDRSKPVILAAHRFGYLVWSNLYRRKNSFYNLPKLSVGDTIEIRYKQRKYIYEVYKEDRGEEISDYSANLILYTCETLNSNIRIFKYARLLQI